MVKARPEKGERHLFQLDTQSAAATRSGLAPFRSIDLNHSPAPETDSGMPTPTLMSKNTPGVNGNSNNTPSNSLFFHRQPPRPCLQPCLPLLLMFTLPHEPSRTTCLSPSGSTGCSINRNRGASTPRPATWPHYQWRAQSHHRAPNLRHLRHLYRRVSNIPSLRWRTNTRVHQCCQ